MPDYFCYCLEDADEHRSNCPNSPDYDGPDDSYWEAERWAPRLPTPYYDGGRLVTPPMRG